MTVSSTNIQPVLYCERLCRHYRQGDKPIAVLNGLDLSVDKGERVAIMGVSGSGKSTLLGLLGALDKPDSGIVTVAGKNIAKLSENTLSQLRNRHLGFVYQFHHLLPEFSALENIRMPALIAGVSKKQATELAHHWLEAVGLSHRSSHRPDALSGGERQRVAIARALVNEPDVVLMDEPTGNLDEQSAKSIQQVIRELADKNAIAFVVVTHDKKGSVSYGHQLRIAQWSFAACLADNY